MIFFVDIHQIILLLVSLLLTVILTWVLYIFIFYVLRTFFRQLETDVPLVTLNVSAYPALTLFILISVKITIDNLSVNPQLEWLSIGISKILIVSIILAAGYWILQLFNQVIIYYFREYSQRTEAMWDEVLVPLVESSTPHIIFLITISLILQFAFGFDLTGIWLTLGGATFVVGFAVKDILANFFSGIALLIDSPFRFGDVLLLEDDSLGMIKKIGVRVTEIYIFESHSDLYIPNSILQNQKINNLSRPIEPVYYSTPLIIPPYWDLEKCRQTMEHIIQAHPDIIGKIENKISFLEEYYNCENNWVGMGETFLIKKENGKQRLLAEKEVNRKLDEIEQSLEALVVTLQFAEKGGLNEEDVKTVQEEYFEILLLIGLEVKVYIPSKKQGIFKVQTKQSTFDIIETREEDTLINLVREWYRTWLKDPDLVDEDRYLLTEIWENKIEHLKKRVGHLLKKILNPDYVETRLDDYANNLVEWLKNRFKQARSELQVPKVWMERLFSEESAYHIKFTLNYYVDDIRLEDCRRGERVNSEIHREILSHFHRDKLFEQYQNNTSANIRNDHHLSDN
ncbi:MAG: mechanosensitive ion channel family protein [Crocosphaera sp.]